jgi:hypothetical protein
MEVGNMNIYTAKMARTDYEPELNVLKIVAPNQ